MRAEAEKLTKDVRELTSINKYNAKIIDMIKDWDKDVRTLLGPNSALKFQSYEEYVNRAILPEYWTVREYKPQTASFDGPSVFDPELSFAIHNLHRVMLEIRYRPEDYRHIIRLLLTNGKSSAMYIDEQYLHEREFTEHDIEYFARQIARELAWYATKKEDNECQTTS